MVKKIQSLTFLFLICASAFGQSKDELKIRALFWDTDEAKKNIKEVPSKWAEESAVILYQDEGFVYTNNGKKMYNPSYFQRRVKLQDKASVESFSEFTYGKDSQIGFGFVNYSRDRKYIGIKIVKPSGKENIIDIDAETITQDEQNKIAIPGLEVGDILDVYVYEDNYLRSFSGTHVYEPVENILSAKYPIVQKRISVEVENDYFLNMEAYNGAPQIKEETTEKRATRKYVLEASDLEKSEFPRWFYPLVELPSVKFQVTFALRGRNELWASVFLADDDAERKTGVSKEEIKEYYGDRFKAYSKKTVKKALNYLEEKGIEDKREQLIQGLYYTRHHSYNRFIELYIASENKISFNPVPCDDDYIILNENSFVNYMAGLAKALEIDYDIIVATEDFNGSIDDLLLRSNVSWGLRFNFDDPLYFFNLSPHVQADFFPEHLEGTKAYVLRVKKDKNIENVDIDTLPISGASENVTEEVIKIQINDDFKNIKLQRDIAYSGHFKVSELQRRVVLSDFLEEEFTHYGTKQFYDCKTKQKARYKTIQQEMEAVYEKIKKKRLEQLEEIVGNGFDLEVEDYNHTIVETSRYSNSPFTLQDSFTLDNTYIKKAGSNYILEAGKFIGGQVQIDDDERERTLNANIDFAKTFKYRVSIKIPEGYEVVGLEKLNKNVANATGSFKSTASVSDGSLTYTSEKIYSKRSYQANEWSQMVLWLDAAYAFSQEKVMFKKI